MTTAPPSQTLTYKTVGALAIELELYLPPTPQNAPILLWFHGGGLLQGQRKSVAPHMLRGVEEYGYALVSADCKYIVRGPFLVWVFLFLSDFFRRYGAHVISFGLLCLKSCCCFRVSLFGAMLEEIPAYKLSMRLLLSEIYSGFKAPYISPLN
jgi:hypothetical protein